MSEFIAKTLEEYKDGQIILIDKPLNWTSFDVVNKMRYIIRKKFDLKKIKVGHGGTLDPLASGLMIVAVGKATKSLDMLQNEDKEYIADICFGATRPSYDMETEIDQHFPAEHISIEKIEAVLKNKFSGKISQIPPLFSAKHINGKRAYEYARNGEDVTLEAREITINDIELIKADLPELRLRINCSKGTYIRSIAYDLGKELGSGAYLSGLRRTKSGSFSIENAISIEEFEKNTLNL